MLTTHQISALTTLVKQGATRVEPKQIGYRTACKLHKLGMITSTIGFTKITFSGLVAVANHGAPVDTYIERGRETAARMLVAQPKRQAHWQAVLSFYSDLAEAVA